MHDPKLETDGEIERSAGFWFAAADLLLELDSDGRIRYAAGAALTLTGSDPDALAGMPLADIVSPHDRRRVDELFAAVRRRNVIGPEAVAMDYTGFVALLGLCSWPQNPACVFAAITLSRMPASRFSAARQRDQATNTLRQDEFAAIASEMVLRGAPDDTDAALLCVEVSAPDGPDRTARSDAGMMAAVAARLRELSFGGDAVTGAGPGRFVLLAKADTDIQAVPRKVRETLGATTFGGAEPKTTCHAIPVDIRGLSQHDTAAVISFAVSRFRELEANGIFGIGSLSEAMKLLLYRTVAKVSALRQSVFSRDFQIVFQPIVSLNGGATHHYEVLSRFRHGDTPYQTVLFAERNGLIEDLDLAVIQKAIVAIQGASSSGHDVQLAVNISARSLGSSILMKTLDELLVALGPLRRNLLLEISETNLIEDLVAAGKLIGRFRSAGTPICLDDFGSGASSFPYLQALPIDFVKLDGSYVRTMLTDFRHLSIIKAIGGLCRDLNIKTIAEMIESEQQASRLRSLGIDFGQGWLFGRPVDALIDASNAARRELMSPAAVPRGDGSA